MFQHDGPLTRLPRQLPGRSDDRIDPPVGERGNGLPRLDQDRLDLVQVDPFAVERGAQFHVEDVARRRAPEPGTRQRAGRGEIAVGTGIDRRAALLKNRCEHPQRQLIRRRRRRRRYLQLGYRRQRDAGDRQ